MPKNVKNTDITKTIENKLILNSKKIITIKKTTIEPINNVAFLFDIDIFILLNILSAHWNICPFTKITHAGIAYSSFEFFIRKSLIQIICITVTYKTFRIFH